MKNHYCLSAGAMSALLLAAAGPARAQAPTLVNVAPAPNARAVPRNAGVVARFSQPLTAGSAGALKVFSSQRGGLRGGGTAQVAGAELSFFPAAYDFRPGETVRVTVTRAAAGAGGPLARPWVQQFTTAVGGTGRGSFLPTAGLADPAVGSAPQGVAVGDLDGDGDLDFVTANAFATGTLSVRLNNGAGTFTAPALGAEVPVSSAPRDLLLGDLDGDGDLDAAAVCSFGNVLSIRLNDGSGGFSAPALGAELATGSDPQGLAVGDFDGDGDLDLVAANRQGASVSVFSNNGAALFTPLAAVSAGSFPYGVLLGDVDGDGDLDLLATNTASFTVSVRLNNGGGAFAPPAQGAECAVATRPGGLALGDVDGDGDLDFVTASQDGNAVSVRLNNGGGAFAPPTALAEVPVGLWPYRVALVDVNRDGHLDLLAVNAGGGASLRLNNGLGGFLPPATNAEIAVGPNPFALALGDLDGDGDLDLLATSQSQNLVSVRLNGATGPLAAAVAPAALAAYPNPATGRVRLAVPPAATRADLLDALGRTVRTVPAQAGAATLDVAGLAPGLYVVRAAGQVARLVVE